MLGAIAVMHIEIDNSDSVQLVSTARVERGDSSTVEKAKTHSPRALRVMSRRAHGTKGIFGIASHNPVNRLDGSTSGAPRRF